MFFQFTGNQIDIIILLLKRNVENFFSIRFQNEMRKEIKTFLFTIVKTFFYFSYNSLSVSENDSKMIKYLKGRIFKLYFIIIFTVTLPK